MSRIRFRLLAALFATMPRPRRTTRAAREAGRLRQRPRAGGRDRIVRGNICTGPVVYTAGTHLCLATPNAIIQEGGRAYYHG